MPAIGNPPRGAVVLLTIRDDGVVRLPIGGGALLSRSRASCL